MAKAGKSQSKGRNRAALSAKDRMEEAFDRGDKVLARQEATQALAAGATGADADSAHDILRRLQIEPAMWRYAAFALAVIVVLAVVGYA